MTHGFDEQNKLLIKKIRDTKTNIVGAAYKIALVEANQGYELSDAERSALVGRHTWENHRDEIIVLSHGIYLPKNLAA